MANVVRTAIAEARWRGFWGTVRAIKMNKFGSHKFLVGEDEQGNRYFENRRETFGRDRWVEFPENKNFDSMNISPRWHAWLHRIVDSPEEVPMDPSYRKPVSPNRTGTRDAYFPPAYLHNSRYGGPVSQKFESWVPDRRAAARSQSGKDVLDLK